MLVNIRFVKFVRPDNGVRSSTAGLDR